MYVVHARVQILQTFCFLFYFWTVIALLFCLFHYLCLQDEQYRGKLNQSNERTLSLIKAGIDIVVAVGLLQLAPKTVNPRVTGAFGFVSSLISCYQVHASIIVVCLLFASIFHP